MTINLNLQQFTTEFSNNEQLPIVANCIETAFRYDYEAVARAIDMPGRTIFAGRGSWRTKGMLTYFILLNDTDFRERYSLTHTNFNDTDLARLNKKRDLLTESIATVGFDRWISEFLKIYSVSWLISRITTVLSHTRTKLSFDNIEFNLNLTLESVR